MDTKELYKNIEDHVTGLYKHINARALVFHNLLHTQNVVKRTMEIIRHYKLSEDERLVLFAAAWFHDTGHLFTEPPMHEAMSCEIMYKFLSTKINEVDIISDIEECIMATKLPTNPQNLLQQIICDADTYHLGTDEFKETNKLVMQEQQLKYGDIDPIVFNKATIRMLQQHCFYTHYCKNKLNEKKENNLNELKKITKGTQNCI